MFNHNPRPALSSLCSKAHPHGSACALKVSVCETCGMGIRVHEGRWHHDAE